MSTDRMPTAPVLTGSLDDCARLQPPTGSRSRTAARLLGRCGDAGLATASEPTAPVVTARRRDRIRTATPSRSRSRRSRRTSRQRQRRPHVAGRSLGCTPTWQRCASARPAAATRLRVPRSQFCKALRDVPRRRSCSGTRERRRAALADARRSTRAPPSYDSFELQYTPSRRFSICTWSFTCGCSRCCGSARAGTPARSSSRTARPSGTRSTRSRVAARPGRLDRAHAGGDGGQPRVRRTETRAQPRATSWR